MINKKTQKGFSVVEAMVAITILLLSITGTFAVAQTSLQSSQFAKNRVTAYFLAQEGLEYIRHLRDNNGLEMLETRTSTNLSWLGGYAQYAPGDENNPDPPGLEGDPCYFGYMCQIDASGQIPPERCDENTNECDYLTIDDQGRYGYDPSGEQTPFIRRIFVGGTNRGTEIEVRVEVVWDQIGYQRSVVIKENLHNWQQVQPL